MRLSTGNIIFILSYVAFLFVFYCISFSCLLKITLDQRDGQVKFCICFMCNCICFVSLLYLLENHGGAEVRGLGRASQHWRRRRAEVSSRGGERLS